MRLPTYKIILADVFEGIKQIEDGSLDLIVSSPPYWAQRDYHADGQLGHEATSEGYCGTMAQVFINLIPKLKPHGLMAINLGDSYVGSGGQGSQTDKAKTGVLNKSDPDYKDRDLANVPHRVFEKIRRAGMYWRSTVIWSKSNGSPESVYGVRWVRHRIKLESAEEKYGSWIGVDHSDKGKKNRVSSGSPKRQARWEDCPGCKKCELHGGFVLSWGSGRPTQSYEPIGLLTKDRYYWDNEAVRTPYAPSSTPRKYRNHFAGNFGAGKDGVKMGRDEAKYESAAELAGANARNVQEIYDNESVLKWLGREYPELYIEYMLWQSEASDILKLPTAQFREEHFACVDTETEMLTASGWKKYNEVESGELAAQYDLASHKLSWGKVESIVSYKVKNQNMVSVGNFNLDIKLTPNHRTIVSKINRNNGTMGLPQIIRADQLTVQHQIPISAEWEAGGESPVSPEFAELLGWYVAEGWENPNGKHLEISQSLSANKSKAERIEYLLSQVGARFSRALGVSKYNGSPYYMYYFQVDGFINLKLREYAPHKLLSHSVLLWDSSLLNCLLNGLVNGDGHVREDGRQCFIQKSKQTIDIVQAIAVRCGYATLVRQRKGMWRLYLTKKRFVGLRGTGGKNKEINTEPYTGIVWCPQMPLGTFVARRNGRMFITGNTFHPDLPAFFIKAGTSEYGCCADCGAPWARKMEQVGKVMEGVHSRTADVNGYSESSALRGNGVTVYKTVGWEKTCKCETDEVVPALVCDPFSGAATTLMTANRLGRDAIGIEISDKFKDIGERRVVNDAPLFYLPGMEVTDAKESSRSEAESEGDIE